MGLILNPERAARLEQYHARDSANPSFQDVTDQLILATWQSKGPTGLEGDVAKTVRYTVLEQFIRLASDESAPMSVRAIAHSGLEKIKTFSGRDYFASTLIADFERDPKQVQIPAEIQLPPGQPIGEDDMPFLR